MKKTSLLALLCALILLPSSLKADEGMWMVNLLEKGLIQKMKKAGLKLPANVIYDENAVSISDAVVSLDFGCTGSMISSQGLLITNHHCAYGDVHSISTPENNYLEDGFWAFTKKEEVPIPGKGVYFLKKVIDVTDEVAALRVQYENDSQFLGSRKLISIMEKKYSESSGYEAGFVGMWRGEKHYIFLYEVYKDIRLVAAPPVSIAAYGGDTDNWEWPQHKGDFALYRVYGDKDGKPAAYSSENIPIVPRRVLPVSTEGVKKGDFTMILGYPGSTDRYSSSFRMDFFEKLKNPITTKIRRDCLDIMNRWMDSNPEIRLKYADKYFGISNVQELDEGTILCLRRFKVVNQRKEQEKELQSWIDSDPDRREKWGTLLSDMEAVYLQTQEDEKQNTYFQETLVRGSEVFRLISATNIMINDLTKKDQTLDTMALSPLTSSKYVNAYEAIFRATDQNVENELTVYSIKTFLRNVDQKVWSNEIMELYNKYGGDIELLATSAIKESTFSDRDRFLQVMKSNPTACLLKKDPLYILYRSITMQDLNKRIQEVEKSVGQSKSYYEKQYTNALYEMNLEKGRVQYPDANSTMRITYGNVGSISPSDGIYYSEHSTYQGILDKYNPDDYEFKLKEKQLNLLEKREWGRWADKKTGSLHINFLSNNDITGGNSGSPVLNAKGELVGLAFDGNKESLAGDFYFHPELNKCVNVDIRYVLWILDKYAGMGNILSEIGVN